MIAAACAMHAQSAPADPLEEARWLCKRNPTLWFKVDHRYDPVSRTSQPVYKIFRRGMGCVAQRSSIDGLLAYLRKQVLSS